MHIRNRLELQLGENKIKEVHTGDVSEAIFMPFGRVVIFVLPGPSSSGNAGGNTTPSSGKSRGGSFLDRSPVSQPKKPKPPEDCCVTAVLASLVAARRTPGPPALR